MTSYVRILFSVLLQLCQGLTLNVEMKFISLISLMLSYVLIVHSLCLKV